MATLWGDMLRLLAHTGLQTGANVGVDYLKSGWAEQAQEKLLGVKAALEATGALTNQEQQQEALRQLQTQSRVKLPTITERGSVLTGETPTLSNLGQRTNVTYPSPMYTPASVEKILPPIPAVETLKSRTGLQLSPEEAKTAFFPTEDKMGIELVKLAAQLGAKKEEKGLDRAAQAIRDQQHTETTRMYQQGMLQYHQGQLTATMDKNKIMATLLGQRAFDQDEKTAHSLIGNAANQYQMIPMNKVEEKVNAANRFNALLDRYGEKYPEAVSGYTRVDPKTPEWGAGYFGGKPLPGVTPKGGPTKTAPPVLTPQEQELMRRGYKKDATGQWSK